MGEKRRKFFESMGLSSGSYIKVFSENVIIMTSVSITGDILGESYW